MMRKLQSGQYRLYSRHKEAKTGKPANRFERESIPGTERILCLNEADGKILCKYEYDCPYEVSYAAGPRTTPLVDSGNVYTLGTMGDLFCLDAATGKVIWSSD